MIHANVRAQDATRVPLRLNDLVRSVDKEPRIPDLTLAERLGFSKPHNVRKLIDRNRPELMLHGALVERSSSFLRDGENPGSPHGTANSRHGGAKNKGGRPGTMYFLNEGQALVVCSLARTPIAVKVRQDVISVYMAHRRGEDWLPPSQREREAMRFLIEHGHVVRTEDPIALDAAGRAVASAVFVSPITDGVLDTFSEFEVDDLFEGEDERDLDVADERHDAIEEGDGEPWLGRPDRIVDQTREAGRGGSSDLELDTADKEPSLGWLTHTATDSNMMDQSPSCLALGGTSDREHDLDTDEGDSAFSKTVDDEPMLGWVGIGTGHDEAREPTSWASCCSGEVEPSLGSPETVLSGGCGGVELSQERWGSSGTSEREIDAGDEPEAVNEDGLEPGAHLGWHTDHGIADEGGLQEQHGVALLGSLDIADASRSLSRQYRLAGGVPFHDRAIFLAEGGA